MVTYSWIKVGSDEEAIPADVYQTHPEACVADGEEFVESGACNDAYSDPVIGGSSNTEGQKEACGRLRLEELALAALWRATEAVWALASRVLRPEAGDVAAAAVSTTSLCSVAFFAVPTFRALEDAERTYQVCICMCVCVCMRASGGERDRERDRGGRRKWGGNAIKVVLVGRSRSPSSTLR